MQAWFNRFFRKRDLLILIVGLAIMQGLVCLRKSNSDLGNGKNGVVGECRGIINYWGVEDTGIVTAKIDEQKTDATRSRILELVGKL